MPELKVYQVDDYVWIIGHDRQSCVEEAVKSHGIEQQDAENDAFELSDEQLEARTYVDFGADANPARHTFKKQLQIEADKGGVFPRLFACTEG